MKKVDSVYVMKCRDAKDPYPHIVNGNFRKLESVMEKAEELKQISTTTQIDVWLKLRKIIKKFITGQGISKINWILNIIKFSMATKSSLYFYI